MELWKLDVANHGLKSVARWPVAPPVGGIRPTRGVKSLFLFDAFYWYVLTQQVVPSASWALAVMPPLISNLNSMVMVGRKSNAFRNRSAVYAFNFGSVDQCCQVVAREVAVSPGGLKIIGVLQAFGIDCNV